MVCRLQPATTELSNPLLFLADFPQCLKRPLKHKQESQSQGHRMEFQMDSNPIDTFLKGNFQQIERTSSPGIQNPEPHTQRNPPNLTRPQAPHTYRQAYRSPLPLLKGIKAIGRPSPFGNAVAPCTHCQIQRFPERKRIEKNRSKRKWLRNRSSETPLPKSEWMHKWSE